MDIGEAVTVPVIVGERLGAGWGKGTAAATAAWPDGSYAFATSSYRPEAMVLESQEQLKVSPERFSSSSEQMTVLEARISILAMRPESSSAVAVTVRAPVTTSFAVIPPVIRTLVG